MAVPEEPPQASEPGELREPVPCSSRLSPAAE